MVDGGVGGGDFWDEQKAMRDMLTEAEAGRLLARRRSDCALHAAASPMRRRACGGLGPVSAWQSRACDETQPRREDLNPI